MQVIVWCGKSIREWVSFIMILLTEIPYLAFNLGKVKK